MSKKPRAVEVELSDGQVITMRQPGREHMGKFFSMTTLYNELQKVIEAAQQNAEGVRMPIPEISPEASAFGDDLLAILTNKTTDEIKEICEANLFDWMALLAAMQSFMPANLQQKIAKS